MMPTVLSKKAPAEIPRHPAHPNHKLKLVGLGADAKFQCKGCMEGGAGDRYRCQPCNFDLHKDCALAEDMLEEHPLFINYKFELRREAPGPGKDERLLCDACGTRVHGWYYHCDRKGLVLHPCCAKLPKEIKHEELTFELRDTATDRCNICRGSGGYGTFWYYRSTCKTKTVYFHVRCVKEKLVTCSSEPAGGGGGSGSTSTTPAANTTTMITSFVQAAVQGYSGNKNECTCEIVKDVVRVILAVISGAPTEKITAAAGLICTYYSTGR